MARWIIKFERGTGNQGITWDTRGKDLGQKKELGKPGMESGEDLGT